MFLYFYFFFLFGPLSVFKYLQSHLPPLLNSLSDEPSDCSQIQNLALVKTRPFAIYRVLLNGDQITDRSTDQPTHRYVSDTSDTRLTRKNSLEGKLPMVSKSSIASRTSSKTVKETQTDKIFSS